MSQEEARKVRFAMMIYRSSMVEQQTYFPNMDLLNARLIAAIGCTLEEANKFFIRLRTTISNKVRMQNGHVV